MTFQPSLQTHFNGLVDTATLRTVRDFGFHWARIDAQESTAATVQQMIADTQACGLHPLPIVYDLDRLLAVPTGLDVEWGNEPDGDILPSTYRERLDEACRRARDYGLRLWAPAISNLDMDSLRWLRWVREAGGDRWPEGLHGISAHRYGDGTFEYAHEGFASREDEVAELLRLCNGLPFIITEFGYPTAPGRRGRLNQRGLSEDQQAERIGQEWDFWRQYDTVPFLYQINDGVKADEKYGIRRCAPDGTLLDWKPAAYQVPKNGGLPMNDAKPTPVLHRRDLIPHPTKGPGYFTCRYPKGSTDTVLSVQPGGDVQTRPMGTDGAWETLIDDGTRAVFEEVDGAWYAFPLVGKK